MTTQFRPSAPEAAEAPLKPIPGDRRRPKWREFRRSYPGILATMSVALVTMLGADAFILYKRAQYNREIERLRAGMTEAERRRTDVLVSSDEKKLQVMIELIRRQATVDKELNLAVSIDSGHMYLQREGAQLRAMRVHAGPEKVVGAPPDTVHMVVPRGARTVERILGADNGWQVPKWVYTDRGLPVPDDRTVKGALGPVAILLNGGTVIYSMPTAGPLNDSSYVLPGSVRASTSDMRAIAPNLKAGMSVYFY
jgi:hypothetical protein